MKISEMQDVRKELESQGFDDEFIRDVFKARFGIAQAKIERQAELRKSYREIARVQRKLAKHETTKRTCPQQRADAVAQEIAPARGLITAGSY